jgi:hypothetical protein
VIPDTNSTHSSLYRVPTGGLPVKAVHDYRLPFKTKVVNWGSPRAASYYDHRKSETAVILGQLRISAGRGSNHVILSAD